MTAVALSNPAFKNLSLFTDSELDLIELALGTASSALTADAEIAQRFSRTVADMLRNESSEMRELLLKIQAER